MQSLFRQKLAFAVSSFVILVGLAVMVGWYIKSPILVQIHASFAPMQFNTALCFVLIGVGTLLNLFEKKQIAMVVAGLAGAIATLTLIQYATGFDFLIDEMLMKHFTITETSHRGRMAPNTAICFFLASVYLFVFNFDEAKSYKHIVLGCTALALFSLASLAIVGYIIDIPAGYGWGNLTRMALHTSIGFLIWSTPLLLYEGGAIRRASQNKVVVKSFALFMSSSLIFILLWHHGVSQQDKDLKLYTLQTMNDVVKGIKDRVNAKTRAVKRMSRRWAHDPDMSDVRWEDDIAAYKEDFKRMVSIERVKNGAPEREKLVMVRVKNNKTRLEYYYPTFAQGEFIGAVKANIDIDGIIADAMGKDENYFNVWVYEDGEAFFKSNPEMKGSLREYKRFMEIKEGNLNWLLEIWPNEKASSLYHSWATTGELLFGLFASVLLAGLVALFEQLKIIHQRSELILESAGEGIYGVDLDDKIMFINKAAANMLGWDAKDLIGFPSHATFHYSDRQGHPVHLKDCPLMDVLKDGRVRSIDDEVFWRKDGTCFDVQYIGHAIRDEHDEIMGAVVTFSDITERKALERSERQKSIAIENINKELEAFSYSVSHDLRAPLRHIAGFIEILKTNPSFQIDDEGKKHFEYVVDAANKMGVLIDDLLQYSRTGRAELKKEKVELAELVKESLGHFSEDIEQNHVEVILDYLPTLEVDRTLMISVFDNLIGNALKFSSKIEKPVLKITSEESEDVFKINIQDNGVGFDQNHANKMFNVFQRLHGSSEYDGTGIGLANVKKIIERHEGTVSATGEVDKGATFSIILPKNKDS